MSVPPHPHTGLQTVSWLFDGEIEHRDSTGAHALVRPGDLNLMTAGSGIQHSEVSTDNTTTLHGVQLWVALPESARHQSPHFDAVASRRQRVGDGVVTLFMGSLADVGLVRAPTYTKLTAAQIDLPAHGSMTLQLDTVCEHALLVDTGEITTGEGDIPTHHLGVLPAGHTSWTITAGDSPVRAVLIGGEPLREEIVMWWNFVGRDHRDIVEARHTWQEGLHHGSQRFGHLTEMPALPAPALPTVTLKSRK
jgi:redox-sensitive bicupin YhaK (pirin superfamily)